MEGVRVRGKGRQDSKKEGRKDEKNSGMANKGNEGGKVWREVGEAQETCKDKGTKRRLQRLQPAPKKGRCE